MKAIIEAESFPESKKDAYLGRLKDAIQAALTEREINKQPKKL